MSKEIKCKGGTFSLTKEEHSLLREIFIEYRKQLSDESIVNHDRVMMPYFKQAYSSLINLFKKFQIYEEWMNND